MIFGFLLKFWRIRYKIWNKLVDFLFKSQNKLIGTFLVKHHHAPNICDSFIPKSQNKEKKTNKFWLDVYLNKIVRWNISACCYYWSNLLINVPGFREFSVPTFGNHPHSVVGPTDAQSFLQEWLISWFSEAQYSPRKWASNIFTIFIVFF